MLKNIRFRDVSVRIALLLAANLIAIPASQAAGTWVVAPNNPGTGGQAFGLWLLTDGRVMSHGSALNNWVVLTPDKTGSYAKGTWKSIASSVHARGGAQQHVLKDGRFFQAGGEFIDGPACTTALCPTTEIYDPVANTWTATATAPLDIGDTGSATLGDGRILDSTRFGSQTQIYNPTTNTWTMGPTMPLSTGDENAWASLQNGGVLAVGFAKDGAAIYNPATNKWIRTGAVPAGFDTGDTGGISQMFDGRVFVYGLAGKSYIYTPGPTAADAGTWVLGPAMLNGDEAEDEFSDVLPNGQVWGGLVSVMFGPGVILQQFDPTTNTVSSATPPPDRNNPYPIGYVNLPNGQVMVTAGSANWIYTPDTGPDDAWRPAVTSVIFNSASNSYTLTGTQISGLINGSDEGDDMTNAQNYPIVWLTDSANNVFYCRSFNFSNMMPSKGSAPETCDFTTPAGLPAGSYNLFVSAVGVISKAAFPFTVGQSTTGAGGASGGGTGGAAGGTDAGADGATGGGATGGRAGGAGGRTGAGGVTGGADAGTDGPASGAGGATTVGGMGGHNGAGGAVGGGIGGSSGTGTVDGGGSGSSGSGASSGCSCSTAGGSSARAGFAGTLLLAGLGLAIARRRRRGR